MSKEFLLQILGYIGFAVLIFSFIYVILPRKCKQCRGKMFAKLKDTASGNKRLIFKCKKCNYEKETFLFLDKDGGS
jgi:hypothetical protein